jgi:hypothetical protein
MFSLISEKQCIMVLTFDFNIYPLLVLEVRDFSVDNFDVVFLSHRAALFVSIDWGFAIILLKKLNSFFCVCLVLCCFWCRYHFGIDCSVVMDLYWQLIHLPGSVILHVFYFLSANYCRHMCFSYRQSISIRCEYFVQTLYFGGG